MAKQTSYDYQIQLAEGLKNSLNNLQESLYAASRAYWSKSNDLNQAGMMDETYNRFVQEYVSETARKIEDAAKQINERDIPFIEKHIAYLEQAIR